MAAGKEGYERLPLGEDQTRASSDHERWQPRRGTVAVFVAGAASGFIVSLLGLLFLFCAFRGNTIPRRDLDAECALHTAKYSPVLRDVKIKYSDHLFNGSFMEEDVYRKAGSDEVDAAWEALGVDYRAGVISEEEGRRSGLTDAHVQVSEKYGGGFIVNVEGMHHLHCLNLVRKSLYFNYNRYKALGDHAFVNDEPILQRHVTHCLDTVRQILMCNVDTGVLGQVWWNPSKPAAFPDFNTIHQCKNYDDVRKWADAHQIEFEADDTPHDFLKKPADDIVLAKLP